jgi:hypothetical protein
VTRGPRTLTLWNERAHPPFTTAMTDLERLHVAVSVFAGVLAAGLLAALAVFLPRDVQPGDLWLFVVVGGGLVPQVFAMGPLAGRVWARSPRPLRGGLIGVAVLGFVASLFVGGGPFVLAALVLAGSSWFARAFPRAWLAVAVLCVVVGLAVLGFLVVTLAG